MQIRGYFYALTPCIHRAFYLNLAGTHFAFSKKSVFFPAIFTSTDSASLEYRNMPYRIFLGGKEAAIMPHEAAFANEVLEIVKVRHAGPVFIQVEDGRMFATIGGNGLNTTGHIVVATDEHRQALDARTRGPD